MRVGEFDITILQHANKNIATKIEFDDKIIFFTNVRDLSYNEVEFIKDNAKENFDFVFVGNENILFEMIENDRKTLRYSGLKFMLQSYENNIF